MTERDAMARAIELAWRGWGRVQPNPLVGAVVLADGEIVGEGWHAEYGRAPRRARGARGGRARGPAERRSCPPWSPAPTRANSRRAPTRFSRAGVRRVVAAVAGPATPVAAGGAELAARARRRGRARPAGRRGGGPERELPASGAGSRRARSSPSSSPPRSTAGSPTPTGTRGGCPVSRARDFVQWLRAGFDAVAVGGVTARADDPSLTVRGPLQPRVPPTRIVFAADGDVPVSLKLVRTAREDPHHRRGVPVGARRDGSRRSRRRASRSCVRSGFREAPCASCASGASGRFWSKGEGGSPARSSRRIWWTATTGCSRPLWLGVGAVPGGRAGFRPTPLERCPPLAGHGAARVGRRHAPRAGPALMFTGIITAVGQVSARAQPRRRARAHHRRSVSAGSRWARASRWTAPASRCSGWAEDDFTAHIIRTSLERTAFDTYEVGRKVNLERALQVGDRLGGHLVQGHVDGVGHGRARGGPRRCPAARPSGAAGGGASLRAARVRSRWTA